MAQGFYCDAVAQRTIVNAVWCGCIKRIFITGAMSMKTKQVVIAAALLASLCMAGLTQACTATNSNGDQRCQTSCQAGQTASCTNGTGSSAPTCECK